MSSITTAAPIRRIALMPSGPMTGKSCMATAAPNCSETADPSSINAEPPTPFARGVIVMR